MQLLKKIYRRLFPRTFKMPCELTQEQSALVDQIRDQKLTYLPVFRLAAIIDTCQKIEQQKLEGRFMEAGCALGGSSVLISRIKNPSRPLDVYDVFGMIPPPTEKDGADVIERYETIRQGKATGIDGDKYYGYEENLKDVVRETLERFGTTEEKDNVSLIEGLVQDTMQVNDPVAFAHIDVDWYDPVMCCLERIVPHLVVGGSVILDDYDAWSGCREATDAYFKEKANADHFAFDTSLGSMKVTRTAI